MPKPTCVIVLDTDRPCGEPATWRLTGMCLIGHPLTRAACDQHQQILHAAPSAGLCAACRSHGVDTRAYITVGKRIRD